MSFLAPWALWLSGAVSAAVIALHILASKNPKVTALPTTRFIPDVPLRATARALRLSDVLLLMLRIAVVMLVGLALARPEWTRARRSVGRVVLVDRSAGVNHAEARDSAARYFRDGDAMIVFDSAAQPVTTNQLATLTGANSSLSPAAGSLSAALVAGMRAAASLRGEADSVQMVIVSDFASGKFDVATPAIRAAWPGRMRIVPLSRSVSAASARSYRDVRALSADDPVRAAVSFASRVDTGAAKIDSVRIERGDAASADTMLARRGFTLVRWPASLDSSGFPARVRVDTAGAVMAGDDGHRVVVVSTFERAVDPLPGRVVAWWADGSPAATERTVAAGCVRDIAIPLPRAGDLALRESTRRLVAALTSPCAGIAGGAPASDSALAQLRGTGPLVATRALARERASSGHLATWLLAAAVALLLIEPLLRRQRAAA
ncbi:MAG: BatA domain-containing protein [Gemmatimonadaceae bacterium]|nr:BatA domain-containing protein [Gemmatimonadaceae bacterium]